MASTGRHNAIQLLRYFPSKWLRLDGALSVVKKKWIIDVIYLDEQMQREKWYDKNLSMKENVVKKYGKRAFELIEKQI